MKRWSALLLVMLFVVGTVPVYAGPDGKGASAQAQEKASSRSVFQRTTDWFATIGKSGEEKEAAIAERQAKRDAKKAEKEARKAAKEAKKEQKAMKDASKKEFKKADKQAHDAKGKIPTHFDDLAS